MINKIAERIEILLIETNQTKYKLAKETGISKSIISDYCKGRVQPTADNIIIFANYFNVSTDYLLGIEDETGRKTYQTNPNTNKEEIGSMGTITNGNITNYNK